MVWLLGRQRGLATALFTLPILWALVIVAIHGERKRWVAALRRLEEQVDAMAVHPAGSHAFAGPVEIAGLIRSLLSVSESFARMAASVPARFTPPGESGTFGVAPTLARSGPFDSETDILGDIVDSSSTGEYSTNDLVDRLEPRLFRWIDSSPAEQAFLGWELRELREKSFLEIVHPDDLMRVRDQFRAALVKGEVHGLTLRIRTARGKHRVIVMSLGARYGTDRQVSHLRCHVKDITAKVRAERELKLRTRELTQVNGQLRLINRELSELQKRYLDLYQNAPTMYFSLGRDGTLLECNDTLLHTLGYRREALLGRSYEILLPEGRRSRFAERFAEFLKEGRIEIASQWVKVDGETIDVWVTGTAVRDESGEIVRSRSVAQDVTAILRLEAELREKNEQLARTIDELSRRNKELDEFNYVVSHDLQEPLRSMTAYSDFLRRDAGDRLGPQGQEFVEHIVSASRRMRSLIHDLLLLSRMGRVAFEPTTVRLDDVLSVVRTDLTELIRSRRAEVQIIGPLPMVWGDRARLGQLFANLIGNGLKYNVAAVPRIEVGVVSQADAGAGEGDRVSKDHVTFFVRDNGIGIDPKYHVRIFQPFRRLHTNAAYEGTGAGLAICEKIVQAHDGRLWVESEPGRGSTFFVSLRKAPDPIAPDNPAPQIEEPNDP
jgi:PAS domain S-box-containing protein